jgi:hypothetical protein
MSPNALAGVPTTGAARMAFQSQATHRIERPAAINATRS